MTHLHNSEFEIIELGEIVEGKEKRPYGRDHTMLVHCFERPVTVRRILMCERCDREFSYEFNTVLHWEQRYLEQTTEQDALKQIFARERKRTSTPDHDNPVICPHCGATQGAIDRPRTGLAKALARFRGMTSVERQHD